MGDKLACDVDVSVLSVVDLTVFATNCITSAGRLLKGKVKEALLSFIGTSLLLGDSSDSVSFL